LSLKSAIRNLQKAVSNVEDYGRHVGTGRARLTSGTTSSKAFYFCNVKNEHFTQSALSESTAFAPAPLPHHAAVSSEAAPYEEPAALEQPDANAPTTQSSDTDVRGAWQAQYEAEIASFRAQSAEQRAKAEKERARWEKIREEEAMNASSHHKEWEEVGASGSGSTSTVTVSASPSPADVRDLVAGERPGHAHAHEHEREDSGTDSGSGSHPEKWEMPSSMSASFPSSFDMDTPPSPSSNNLHRAERTHHHHGGHHAPVPLPPPLGAAAHAPARGHAGSSSKPENEPISATLSVLNTSLPVKTRAFALFSSLAINFFLPFLNGVMLGFGEIFAKEVVAGWIGWKPLGAPRRSAPTAVGVGVPLPNERRARTPFTK
jgi:hypothetical protein